MVKLSMSIRIQPMPNAVTELYIVQVQYTDGGMLFTNSNQGRGFTFEQAQSIKEKWNDPTPAP